MGGKFSLMNRGARHRNIEDLDNPPQRWAVIAAWQFWVWLAMYRPVLLWPAALATAIIGFVKRRTHKQMAKVA